MNRREADKIRNSISMCEMKLRRLEPYLCEDKPALSREYNRILIEKAVLRGRLQQSAAPLLSKLAAKFLPKFEKKLICDYFK